MIGIRVLVPTFVVFFVAISATPTAQATGAVVPAGEPCDFDFSVGFAGFPQQFKDFTDDDGNILRQIIAGNGVETTVTNLETGKSITLPMPGGTIQTTVNPDGTESVVRTGHNIWIQYPGPTVTQYAGRLEYTRIPLPEEAFINELTAASGHTTDICAAIS